MKDKNIIIEKYKNKLFDDYYSYINIIDYLNSSIPDFAEDMGLKIKKNTKFNYHDFCTNFLILLKDYAEANNDIQDTRVLFRIFEQMMMDKILENLSRKKVIYTEKNNH
jgi:hypothetical protein